MVAEAAQVHQISQKRKKEEENLFKKETGWWDTGMGWRSGGVAHVRKDYITIQKAKYLSITRTPLRPSSFEAKVQQKTIIFSPASCKKMHILKTLTAPPGKKDLHFCDPKMSYFFAVLRHPIFLLP